MSYSESEMEKDLPEFSYSNFLDCLFLKSKLRKKKKRGIFIISAMFRLENESK